MEKNREELERALKKLQQDLIELRDKKFKECVNPAIKRLAEIQRDYALFNDQHFLQPSETIVDRFCDEMSENGYKITRLRRQYTIAEKIVNFFKNFGRKK